MHLERRDTNASRWRLGDAIAVNCRGKRESSNARNRRSANKLKLGTNARNTVLIIHIGVLLPLLIIKKHLENRESTIANSRLISARRRGNLHRRISTLGRNSDSLDHANMEGLAGQVRAGQFSATLEHRHTGPAVPAVPRATIDSPVGAWARSAVPPGVCHQEVWYRDQWSLVPSALGNTRGHLGPVGPHPTSVGGGAGSQGASTRQPLPLFSEGGGLWPCPLSVVSGRRGHATGVTG